MSTYRPMWSAVLRVPSAGSRRERAEQEDTGEVITLPVRVMDATLTRNDHNHADELSLTLDWQNVGLDPRLIRNANVQFHMGQADEFGVWESSSANCQFIGTVINPRRESGEEEPYQLSLTALDYTDYFLRAKPFGTSGIPEYSQRLDEAWRRIVSQTPGAERLANRLERRGFDAWPQLGDAAAPRTRGLSPQIPTKPKTDAWAVWQQTVGMMGLLSFVELDKVIVTTPDAYYRTDDPAKLVWGHNISRISEERNDRAFATGVGLTSHDPISGTTLEAVFPPRRDRRVGRKRVAAAQTDASPEARIVERYDWFTFPGVTVLAALQKVCRRVYLERSKQEFQGQATTHEMVIESDSGKKFDILDLHIGDSIRIAHSEHVIGPLLKLTTRSERVRYLVSEGYQRQAAEIFAAAAEELPLLDQRFYLKGVRITVSSDEDGGTFDAELSYCNRILVDGSASTDTEQR